MQMFDKIFRVRDVSSVDLEGYLNEVAQESWSLHSIHQSGGNASLPYFTVVAYGGFNWLDHNMKKRQAELDAEKKAAEKWELTMGTTGGHANE